MEVIIKFETDNAAFEGPNWGLEVKRILNRLADTLAESVPPHRYVTLFDSNGNRVGTCKVRE